MLGRLSGPLRDREVLVAELTRLGLVHLAPADEAQRAAGYLAIASSGELADLMLLLDGWPANWREAARQGQLNDVDKRIRRACGASNDNWPARYAIRRMTAIACAC